MNYDIPKEEQENVLYTYWQLLRRVEAQTRRDNVLNQMLVIDGYKVLQRLGWNVNPDKWITDTQFKPIETKGLHTATLEGGTKVVAWYNPSTGHWLNKEQDHEIGFGGILYEKKIVSVEPLKGCIGCVHLTIGDGSECFNGWHCGAKCQTIKDADIRTNWCPLVLG
jgi:hypothetical protein